MASSLLKAFIVGCYVSAAAAASVLADLPTQIHIALAGADGKGNSNGMAVSWNTKSMTTTSIVKYGVASGRYDQVSSGSASAYYKTYNHHVVLSALQPSMNYYYIVGGDASGWSNEMRFKSAPLSSDLRGNFSFIVFGDLGVFNGDPTKDYIKSISKDVQLVWHAGDVSYADDSFLHAGCATQFCYEDTFDTYMSGIEPWASALPYMTSPGNHEADCHDPACLANPITSKKLSNFTAYNSRFRMPSQESGGVLNMHYSFNYGNIHFISVDAETGYAGAPEETHYVLPCGGFGDQLTWLEKDLIQANAERDVRPWILAAGHHPMYQGDSIDSSLQKAMEDLFYKYGVDVYFSGHVHSYERDLPVYKGVPEQSYVNPRATTHILVGGAGNDEMTGIQLDRSKDPSPQTRVESGSNGAWTAVTDVDNHVGIGKVTIVDDSTLKFDYIRTMTGEVFDSITLTRKHAPMK